MILKTKADLKDGPDNINSHPWICFLLIYWLSFGERERERGGFHLKLDAQGHEGGRILDVDGRRGGESWKLDNFYRHHMCIIPLADWETILIWFSDASLFPMIEKSRESIGNLWWSFNWTLLQWELMVLF